MRNSSRLAIIVGLSILQFGFSTVAATAEIGQRTLFPLQLPNKQFLRFSAEGFGDEPACGVIYRKDDSVTCGMPLGGIDTGCLDLETNGTLGYCTIFNTHIPRRGPLNAPLLGLSVGGKTWVLCDPNPRDGWGEFQSSRSHRSYELWRGGKWDHPTEPLTPIPAGMTRDGVQTVQQIHYWGHYPIADLEFRTDAPVSVGLRAWSPFLPGDVLGSLTPAAVFEVHLRNATDLPQTGAVALTFPGPLPEEAGAARFSRKRIDGDVQGVEVAAPLASYALGLIGKETVRTGGDLAADASAWVRIHEQLPQAGSDHAGTSLAVDIALPPRESQVLRFVLTWYAPTWNAGGYNWASAPHTFTHMYARYYPNALQTAEMLAKEHGELLRRIIAWQKVVYAEGSLPVWLRESLVNVLHLITETGLWAQAKPPLPAWVRADDGLFGMIECPRGCPQIECIPCSFYGNQPLVYFFPQLALSTLRGYKGYQYPDGAAVWIFGGCTGQTPPIDFANPTRGYQFATNGVSLAAMVDRYFLCYGDTEKDFVKEFFPTVKQNMIYTVNLRPAYPIGDRIIAMPTGNLGTEWFEAPKPGWCGMTAHIGGLHLAQLRIAERMAKLAGDEPFAKQCGEWIEAGAKSMNEKLWTGAYYLNYLEPETKLRSDLIFGYQLDGQWITMSHGLASALPADRVKTTLATIKRANIAVTKSGAVNYVGPDGKPASVGGYGTYSYFPPEALMLAMTYIYCGEREFGVELARRVWHNLVCIQGYTWDMPNIMRGDVDTGERTFGNDYYQDMMLWSLPAALAGHDFGAPAKVNGLVQRMIRAARRRDSADTAAKR
ncbi:MAG: GH116 family glycosyl hydrolase [Thermoguttaceae bacterium]